MASIVALRRRIDETQRAPAATGGAGAGTDGRTATLIREAGLSGLVRPASAHAGEVAGSGEDRVLPVLPELRSLFPAGGLRRGSTVAVHPGHPSVMLALLVAASAAGSWCAVAGLPTLGAMAAAELGIALDRLALVPHPGPEWPAVVGALLDGFDLVVAAPPGPVAATLAGRLAARARQRGSVLVPNAQWSGADVVLGSRGGGWEGLDQGHGRLRRRYLTITAHGRGAAARSREVTVWLPGNDGRLSAATPPAVTPLPVPDAPPALVAV
jgi:hypothetical protein